MAVGETKPLGAHDADKNAINCITYCQVIDVEIDIDFFLIELE